MRPIHMLCRAGWATSGLPNIGPSFRNRSRNHRGANRKPNRPQESAIEITDHPPGEAPPGEGGECVNKMHIEHALASRERPKQPRSNEWRPTTNSNKKKGEQRKAKNHNRKGNARQITPNKNTKRIRQANDLQSVRELISPPAAPRLHPNADSEPHELNRRAQGAPFKVDLVQDACRHVLWLEYLRRTPGFLLMCSWT